jgi:hypothetical protein
VKSAPAHSLGNERTIIKKFGHRPGFRRLINEIYHSPLLVLRYFDEYPVQIMIKQTNFLGPFPEKFKEIAAEEKAGMAMQLNAYVENLESKDRKPFALAADSELSAKDRKFICKIMRLDPRDRPMANELLGDEWFNGP